MFSWWTFFESYNNEECSFFTKHSELHKLVNLFFILFLSSGSHSPDLALKAFSSI